MEDLEFFVKLLFRATNQRITYVPEYLSYYVLRKKLFILSRPDGFAFICYESDSRCIETNI